MRHQVIAALAATIVIVSTGAARADVTTTRYRARGEIAEASFVWSDECSWGLAFVHAGTSVVREGGDGTETAHTYAWIMGNDWCTGRSISGFGEIASADVERLTGATLRVPMWISDFGCSWTEETGYVCEDRSSEAVFEVVLDGEGAITHTTSTTSQIGGTFHSRSRDVGLFRSADVGSATLLASDGRDYLEGATPERHYLMSTTQSTHTLTRVR